MKAVRLMVYSRTDCRSERTAIKRASS